MAEDAFIYLASFMNLVMAPEVAAASANSFQRILD
jgi:hypothetical protein